MGYAVKCLLLMAVVIHMAVVVGCAAIIPDYNSRSIGMGKPPPPYVALRLIPFGP